MTRRCSQCNNNGHNTRTCPAKGGAGGGVRLFGVRLTEGLPAIKKSASVGCLPNASHSAAVVAGASFVAGDAVADHSGGAAAGYASDDPSHASCSMNCRSERKKGVPWTEEEHRMFLLGLQRLGKGDWRGIARNYVASRTPTQVASHAQKYFIRQSNSTRRKRRSSLFDMVPETPHERVAFHEEQFRPRSFPSDLKKTNDLQALHFRQQRRPELVVPSTTNHVRDLGERIAYNNAHIAMVPTFYPTFVPVPVPFWPSSVTSTDKKDVAKEEKMPNAHEILKPTPVVRKETVNVDEVAIMSKLSINENAVSRLEPTPLSLKLHGAASSRQSAFHINSSSVAGPDRNQTCSSPIHAV